MSTDPDEAAFPTSTGGFQYAGLTKRELFAAMAMNGMLANMHGHSVSDVEVAVKHADALISALNKEAKP